MRCLVRAHKHPLLVASAQETLRRDLIGDNAGNLVFSQAVVRLLSTQGSQVHAGRLGPRSKVTVERINSDYDHLVLPLANAFRDPFVPALEHLTTLVAHLRVPVTVLGVGAQGSLDGVFEHPARVDETARRFVAAVLDHSPSIGVRGELTREYLRGLGFGDEHVRVIGCPSMFTDGPRLHVDDGADHLETDAAIAVNVSPYVTQMGPIVAHHAARYPRLTYVAQEAASLNLLVNGRYEGPGDPASGLPVSAEHVLMQRDRVRFFLDPRTWVQEAADFDFCFGTRIHGNIASLLAGTPAVVLAHDSRTLELSEYHQIPHRRIDEVEPDIDAADLYQQADWAPMMAGHAARFDTYAEFLAEHGLPHVFEPGQSPAAFDEALAAATFPPAVRTMRGWDLGSLYDLKREAETLRRRNRRLRTKLDRARSTASPRGGFRSILGVARATVRGRLNRRSYDSPPNRREPDRQAVGRDRP